MFFWRTSEITGVGLLAVGARKRPECQRAGVRWIALLFGLFVYEVSFLQLSPTQCQILIDLGPQKLLGERWKGDINQSAPNAGLLGGASGECQFGDAGFVEPAEAHFRQLGILIERGLGERGMDALPGGQRERDASVLGGVFG